MSDQTMSVQPSGVKRKPRLIERVMAVGLFLTTISFAGYTVYLVATAESEETRNDRMTMVSDYFMKAAGVGCDDTKAAPRLNNELQTVYTSGSFEFKDPGNGYDGFRPFNPLSPENDAFIRDAFTKISNEGYTICFDNALNVDDGNYRYGAVIYPAEKVISIPSFFNTSEVARIVAKAIEFIAFDYDTNQSGKVDVLIAEGYGVNVTKGRDYYNPLGVTKWQVRDDSAFPPAPAPGN